MLEHSLRASVITPATLVVIADAKPKVYGDVDTGLTYTVSGLKFNDSMVNSLTGSSVRDVGETIGTYRIGQGSLATTANYSLNYVAGALSIVSQAAKVKTDVIRLAEVTKTIKQCMR